MKKALIILLAALILTSGAFVASSFKKAEADVNLYPVQKIYCQDSVGRTKTFTAFVGSIQSVVTKNVENDGIKDLYSCSLVSKDSKGNDKNYALHPAIKNSEIIVWSNLYSEVDPSDLEGIVYGEPAKGDMLTVYYYATDSFIYGELTSNTAIVNSVDGNTIKLDITPNNQMAGGIAYNKNEQIVGVVTATGLIKSDRINDYVAQNKNLLMNNGNLLDAWKYTVNSQIENLKNEAENSNMSRDTLVAKIKQVMNGQAGSLSKLLSNGYKSSYQDFVNVAVDEKFKDMCKESVIKEMSGITDSINTMKSNQVITFLASSETKEFKGLIGDVKSNTFVFGNPANTLTKDGDYDEDGLSNYQEYIWGTNPYNKDTDGDGYDDGLEAQNGYSPVIARDVEKSL